MTEFLYGSEDQNLGSLTIYLLLLKVSTTISIFVVIYMFKTYIDLGNPQKMYILAIRAALRGWGAIRKKLPFGEKIYKSFLSLIKTKMIGTTWLYSTAVTTLYEQDVFKLIFATFVKISNFFSASLAMFSCFNQVDYQEKSSLMILFLKEFINCKNKK